ncbi:putative non-specific serine/threonine protein kinase [Helianthus annuus]|nr:putative non-specific serine/threonine protein kinase [Helianthus annuus]
MNASAGTQDLNYLYASIANVSNFVSVKLSGNTNYHVWKSQMLCLLNSNNMGGIVDATFARPRYCEPETLRQYDNLARGWILGSVSEDVLADVHNLGSAKAVWEKLQSICISPVSLQEDSNSKKSDAETEKEVDRDVVAAETINVEEGTNSIEIIVDQGIVPIETDTKSEDEENPEKRRFYEDLLLDALLRGHWSRVEDILETYKDMVTKALSDDGSTVLHIAVGRGQNDFVKKLCSSITEEQLLHQRENDGSTALHIAAIVGNKDAAELLVERNGRFLGIEDHKGRDPLHVAYENMHLDTIGYLLKAVKDAHPDDEIGTGLLVNAISAKRYSLALDLVERFPMFASKKDDVLVAIAKTFPSELDNWETLVYPPDLNNILEVLPEVAGGTLVLLVWPALAIRSYIKYSNSTIRTFLYDLVILTVIPIKRIDEKKKHLIEAERVLRLVCKEISKEKSSSDHFARPILEAACQNAYQVVREILYHCSRATLQSTDKNGHDIIQLAIINRSEKIYNLIFDIGERKNVYRTCKDSYENNILHLAGKLAPSSVLNRRTGAALQLQRELQWFQEVGKFVFPSYTTKENIDNETPYMVFTREHKELLKEGEQWMKTTAESCSITAALIVTIVFAAAITVPGGSNQEKGTPLFKSKAAFIIFAIADAISLFASSTALLVFLSILTTRFAEKDFLVSLPRRLFIGIFSLLLSTTTMMVAFSATLFLVFCDNKPWMLAPICGLAFIPIAFFVSLQFPLMVDLLWSTYSPIFGKQRNSIGLLMLINRIDQKLGQWFDW